MTAVVLLSTAESPGWLTVVTDRVARYVMRKLAVVVQTHAERKRRIRPDGQGRRTQLSGNRTQNPLFDRCVRRLRRRKLHVHRPVGARAGDPERTSEAARNPVVGV